MTQDHKNKIGVANKGHIVTPETREKISFKNTIAWIGKIHPHSGIHIPVATPRHYGNIISVKCAICPNVFKYPVSHHRKYCSRQCFIEAWVEARKHNMGRDTVPEKLLEQELINYSIPFKKQIRIGRTVIDFLIGDIAIYVDGDYWHSKDEKVLNQDARINQFLISKNYSVIRIWEFEIMNAITRKQIVEDVSQMRIY